MSRSVQYVLRTLKSKLRDSLLCIVIIMGICCWKTQNARYTRWNWTTLGRRNRAPPRAIKAADSYSHREPHTARGVKSQYYYVRARDNDPYRQSGDNIMVCPGYQAKCSQNLGWRPDPASRHYRLHWHHRHQLQMGKGDFPRTISEKQVHIVKSGKARTDKNPSKTSVLVWRFTADMT